MRSIAFTYLCEVLVLLHAWSYLLQIAGHLPVSLQSLRVNVIDLIKAWRDSDELAVEQVKGKVNYAICIANR